MAGTLLDALSRIRRATLTCVRSSAINKTSALRGAHWKVSSGREYSQAEA